MSADAVAWVIDTLLDDRVKLTPGHRFQLAQALATTSSRCLQPCCNPAPGRCRKCGGPITQPERGRPRLDCAGCSPPRRKKAKKLV